MNRVIGLLTFMIGSIFCFGHGMARAASIPFTQCPPSGLSPSCAVLITINPGGSLTYQVDPAIGPYDGIDDQLVAVLNQSGISQPSVTLSGPSSFGFDGDGAGLTGYEGPNMSFSVVDSNDGSVIFTGGLPNGSSRWFSLESAPNIPTVVASKTITNGTSQAADEIRVVIRGVQEVVGNTGPTGSTFSFSVDAVTSNTTLDWKLPPSGAIPVGTSVDIGFSMHVDHPEFLEVQWLSAGTPLGCAPQISAGTNLIGSGVPKLIFSGSTTLCPSANQFVGQMSVDWYSSPPVSGTPASAPLRTDTINLPPLQIAPGGTAQIALTGGPPGAQVAVIHYKVGTNSTLTGTTTLDKIQIPAYVAAQASGCTSSSQCPTGESCVGGVCVAPLACTTRADCPTGFVCTNHFCVTAAAPTVPLWGNPGLVAMAALLVGMGVVMTIRARKTGRGQ